MPSIASRIELQDPGGNFLKVRQVTVREIVNRGWTWSAVLNEPPPMDDYLEDATYTLTLHASGSSLTLPPLVAQQPEEDVVGGVGGSLAGIDLVSYRLTRSTHVIPESYRNTTSQAIIEHIAGEIGMTGSISGHTGWSFPILEEEVGTRTNFLSVIERLATAAGYEFRMVAGGSVGILEFYPLEIAPAGSAGPQPDWTRIRRRRNFTNRITQLKFLKTSRMQAGQGFTAAAPGDVFPLSSSMHSAQATQPSTTLWNGDPSSGGTLLGTGVAFNPASPVTHVQAAAAGPVTVLGNRSSAVPAGVELAFEHPHDTGISPPRPEDEPWTETLWPNKAYVVARAQTYMWARNRDTHGLSWEGPPCLWLGLGYRLTWPGQRDSRVESIEHVLGDGQAMTRVESAVLASAQW